MQAVEWEGARFWVRIFDPASERLSLHWKNGDGQPLETFVALREAVEAGGNRRLLFATNAGMFTPAAAPVGLHVEAGKELAPLNTAEGEGNFFLKPNGVFFMNDRGTAGVWETERYAKEKPGGVRLGTQSGPMLVRSGEMHPAFRQGSPNRTIRSGVGVTVEGHVVFALSEKAVNFFDFATLFRDALACPDALYLDGLISRAWWPEAPSLSLAKGERFTGMIAITAAADDGER